MRALVMLFAGAILTACATSSVGGVSTPAGPAAIPSTPLDLGNWRGGSEASTLQAFQQTIAQRYGAGLALSAVGADLRRNDFACAAASPSERGDPPAQICRRTITLSGCTHTWQVHVFDAAGNGRLARTRGLYDRRCGGDGLLGGPG